MKRILGPRSSRTARAAQKTIFFFWLLALSLGLAGTMALAQGPGEAASTPDASAPSASPDAQAASTAPAAATSVTGTPAAKAAPGIAAPQDEFGPHGMSPLYGDLRVPYEMMPPGSFEPDPGPSRVVFPRQQITIRFNHRFHLTQAGATCKTCHAKAYGSNSVQDHLTPAGTVCDACHLTDHSNLAKVAPGDGDEGKCGFCHLGYKDGDGNLVAQMSLPRANMVFNHEKHVSKNINCQQCHGAVQDLELATRDQLPRMRGCFRCHQMTDSAARGNARSDCTTCHVKSKATAAGSGLRMQTVFASGELVPPRWLRNANHTADWIQRHKMVAGNDSEFCSNCHKEDFCTDCHDGRVRPRNIHPNDYISMHPIDARQASQKCQSCHREQTFCLTCHQRLGIAMTSPSDVRMSSRFHPPKSVWSDAPRQPGHHSFEAERNLNACVSCHVERDCVVCHGGQGIGGGFDPHKSGFAGGCATQMRRNPRPCFVCHNPGDGVLAQCR